MPLKERQLEEWFENEVTRHFLDLLERRLEEVFKARGGVYFPLEPQKTQETKAMLIGEESSLQDVIDVLKEQDFSQLEEDDEQVGDTSGRGSGTDQAGLN